MRAVILADGDPPSRELARCLTKRAQLVLATDGAAHRAVALGITPHIVCGDFDSVGMEIAELKAAFPHSEIVPTPDQSYADLEKAILLARERGATEIAQMGNVGGRTDHTLASFALLTRYAPQFPIWQVSDHRTEDRSLALVMGVVSEGRECLVQATPGYTLSMVTFTGASVSISGVAWPLESYPLEPGTLGVSNVATEQEIRVEAQTGSIFLILHREVEDCLEGWRWNQIAR